MGAKSKILAYLSKHNSKPVSGKELREHLGVSRQALNVQMRSLIQSGDVAKLGSTRGARYSLADRTSKIASASRVCALSGLDESKIYDELSVSLNLRSQLRDNVEAIVHYAFTEMLNNAIEHSGADQCKIGFSLEAGLVNFHIKDSGIGVFHSIASKLLLDSETTALVELLKGKTTTMSASHTGEGIFFTSKVADRLLLRSHRIQIDWNKFRNDVFVSQRRFIKGTDVCFLIQRDARRRLDAVFGEFAPAEYDFQFQKTKVLVRLLQSDYISRSEAKRLLANLEKFTEIILDFHGVKSVGQGFADEVFRIFAGRYPNIKVSVENANPTVGAMLRHVGRS